MINAPRLHVQSEDARQFGYFRMFLLAIYFGALLMSSPEHRSNAGIETFIVIIALNLAKSAWVFGRALVDGARFNTKDASIVFSKIWACISVWQHFIVNCCKTTRYLDNGKCYTLWHL